MKKKIVITSLTLFLSITAKLFSQESFSPILTYEGIFDTLSDQDGAQYLLANLSTTTAPRKGYSTGTIMAAPTVTCNAGYFKLYFEQGSIFTNTPSAQTMLCQVFSDISAFIVSSCTTGVINIYCADTPTSSGALGISSSFFSFPANPSSPNQGIIDNQIYKFLISGQDPYATLPLSFATANTFYHGMIQIDPTPPSPWNFNLNTVSIGAEYDAYTVITKKLVVAK